jgi:hypothetical protein
MTTTSTAPAIPNRPIAFLLGLGCIGLIVYGISTIAIELITLGCLLVTWLLLALCFRTRRTFWFGLGLVLVGIFAQSLTLYMIDPLSIHQRKENMRTLLAAFHEYDKVHAHLPALCQLRSARSTTTQLACAAPASSG